MTLPTTGSLSILIFGSAVDGYQSFADAGASGKYIKYTIEDANGNWEVGTCYVSTTGTQTFSRDPHASSNSGSTINLSGDAVIFATTSHHEVASRQLLYTTKLTNTSTAVSSISYDWKRGTGGGYTDDATERYSRYEIVIEKLGGNSDYRRLYLRWRTTQQAGYSNPSSINNTTYTGSDYVTQHNETYSSTNYAARTTSDRVYLNRYSYCHRYAGWSGTITVSRGVNEYNTSDSDYAQTYHSVGGYMDHNNVPITHLAYGYLDQRDYDIGGFYLYFSSGTVNQGKVSLYGVRD